VLEDVLGKLTRFDPVAETQVIVPLNEKSPLSRKAVNDRLAKLLNPNGRRENGCPFAVGDKIICLKNSKLKTVVPIGTFGDPSMAERAGNYQPDPDDPTAFVANGAQARVVAVGPKQFVARFDGGRLVLVPARPVREADAGEGDDDAGAAGDFDLAYAITVHKSQGSEWPLVIALVDPAGGSIADRHFWYTAISRARTACLLIGDGAALAQQCGRQSLARRKTYLAELIRGDADASDR
jgi:ATP-dependent exoDNAse (exonuclease V) alpha subunit